jgi:nucleoside-diphosphate-sugar epimerase
MQLMEAPAENLNVRTSYNVAGMHFTPQELAESIRDSYKRFVVDYQHDYRQTIAESWPYGINDDQARKDWGWHSNYNLPAMTASMLHHLGKRYPDLIPEN